LERAYVRRLNLEWVAVLGVALAGPAWAAEPQAAMQSTATTLSAETRIQNGHTLSSVAVAVTGEDGAPPTGTVVIEDDGRQLAGAALSAEGRARLEFALPTGDHKLVAVYNGDETHSTSVSGISGVRAQATSSTPDFQVSVAPASLSVTAGQSGSAIVSLTPINASSLTGPMFVTLACTGFPDQSNCKFTPANVEILPNATAATTSSMSLVTQGRNRTAALDRTEHNSVAWAVLLPGTLGLAGLAFSARRKRWLSRLALVALIGLVSVLGATACAPRYNYYNHGPPYNLPTPAGSYTLQISAQSSNGIAATTHTTQFALTVK
jgi:Bacterial Ig-like domain (group 3)